MHTTCKLSKMREGGKIIVKREEEKRYENIQNKYRDTRDIHLIG